MQKPHQGYPKENNITSKLILVCFVSLFFVKLAYCDNLLTDLKEGFGSKKVTSSNNKKSKKVKKEDEPTAIEEQARMYRQQGIELQRIGNIDGAMSLYQKAIELDPTYAVAYNDLGVLYEAKGFTDRAEESYLRANKVDPNLLSAYTNLALVYETKRDLKKASFYWKERAELGSPDDPWTEKARKRYEDIKSVSSDTPYKDAIEQEAIGMVKDIENQKAYLNKDDKAQAKVTFAKAKKIYKKGDEATAIKYAIDASQLDPSNTEIEEFIDKATNRRLSR